MTLHIEMQTKCILFPPFWFTLFKQRMYVNLVIAISWKWPLLRQQMLFLINGCGCVFISNFQYFENTSTFNAWKIKNVTLKVTHRIRTCSSVKSFYIWSINLSFILQKDILDSVDWDAWFHTPGMPPVIPEYDQSMNKVCTQLADRWATVSVMNFSIYVIVMCLKKCYSVNRFE